MVGLVQDWSSHLYGLALHQNYICGAKEVVLIKRTRNRCDRNSIFLLLISLGIILWVVRPKGGWSQTATKKEIHSLLAKCEAQPGLIEYVSLLETQGQSVICELKLFDHQPMRVGTGVEATVTWLKIKSLKEGTDTPSYLLENK